MKTISDYYQYMTSGQYEQDLQNGRQTETADEEIISGVNITITTPWHKGQNTLYLTEKTLYRAIIVNGHYYTEPKNTQEITFPTNIHDNLKKPFIETTNKNGETTLTTAHQTLNGKPMNENQTAMYLRYLQEGTTTTQQQFLTKHYPFNEDPHYIKMQNHLRELKDEEAENLPTVIPTPPNTAHRYDMIETKWTFLNPDHLSHDLPLEFDVTPKTIQQTTLQNYLKNLEINQTAKNNPKQTAQQTIQQTILTKNKNGYSTIVFDQNNHLLDETQLANKIIEHINKQ